MEREGRVVGSGYGVSFLGDGNVLKLDGGHTTFFFFFFF